MINRFFKKKKLKEEEKTLEDDAQICPAQEY